MEKFEELLGRASLVIAHGGAGTLIHVFRARKVPIVMPRRMEYGEHIDDHQTELIEVLARDGRVIPVSEAEDLPQAVSQARSRNIEPRPEKTPPLVGLVAEAIRQLTEERS